MSTRAAVIIGLFLCLGILGSTVLIMLWLNISRASGVAKATANTQSQALAIFENTDGNCRNGDDEDCSYGRNKLRDMGFFDAANVLAIHEDIGSFLGSAPTLYEEQQKWLNGQFVQSDYETASAEAAATGDARYQSFEDEAALLKERDTGQLPVDLVLFKAYL